jgi:methyl-accepting chemotaxis protein
MPVFKSIRFKFAIPISLLLLLIFSIQTLINIRAIEPRLVSSINSEVKSFSQLANRLFVEAYERYYPSGFSKFKEILEETWKLSPNTKRIQLVNMEGKILIDTGDLRLKGAEELETVDSQTLEKIRSPESSYILENEKKGTLKKIISPYIDEWNRHQYSLIYFISYEAVQKETTQTINRTIFLALALLISSLILTSLITFTVTKPLSELEKGVRIIGKGNLDYRVKIKTGDEIEQLAEEFNKMTGKLKNLISELEEAKGSLEIKVKERTKQLQERIEELEKFHKVTVGRELKMIELKKEIEELKEELKKYKGREKINKT